MRRLGISTSTPRKLFSRAWRTRIFSWLSAGCWLINQAYAENSRQTRAHLVKLAIMTGHGGGSNYERIHDSHARAEKAMSNEPRKLVKLGSLTVLFGCLALAGCGSTTAGSASEEPSSPTQSASLESSSPQASAPEASTSPTAAASSSAAGESEQTETIGGQELGKLPSNAIEYADALVVAWGNGNEAQMQQLATAQVITSLT